MATDVGYRFVPDIVLCPGETIRELLEEKSISQKDFSLRLGRTEKNVSQLVNGKAPVTPETAIELERVLGVSAAFWNSAESLYRDHLARIQEEERLTAEIEWLDAFPIKTMSDNGWIAKESTPAEQAAEMLDFFGVSSSQGWSDYWSSPKRLAARMSMAFEADPPALTAWLRQGELEAERIETEPYDEALFRDVLARLRTVTRSAPDTWFETLSRECASAGVAFVLVRELPKIRCHAVSWWADPDKAVIEMCLRYKADDHFWFSFFHEAAHILKHGKRKAHIHELDERSPEEVAADRWASRFLVPQKEYEALTSQTPLSKVDVVELADRIGVAPGIVVGRLQHDGVIPHSHMNGLKVRLEWA